MNNIYENHRLAILFSDDAHEGLRHSFFSGILDSFKVTAEEAGYIIGFLNVYRNNNGIESYLDQMSSNHFDGVLIASIDYENQGVKELLNSAYPIVTIDHDDIGVTNVSSDNIGGVRKLVEYLIEMGHSRIAFIKGDDNFVTTQRENCFLETCADHGISIPVNYIRQGKYRALDKAAFNTEQLLALPIPPTCIMYSDDYAAIGGKNVLRARGLSVPADMSIVGYDGIDVLNKIEPVCSTVCQNTKEMGRMAAVRLMDIVENPNTASGENIIVETMLEPGHTIKKIYS